MINKKFADKHDFPFRLGCTSYVYPGDILFNAERLAPVFDDIELVLFESSDVSNLPDRRTIQSLKTIAKSFGVTYTVHFPIDKKAGALEEKERLAFLYQIRSIIDLTSGLSPFACILHFEGIHRNSSIDEQNIWHSNINDFSNRLVSTTSLDPQNICVENLDYPFDWHDDIITNHGFSYCADIGHMLLYKEDWLSITNKILEKTRVIHLHGVLDGKDHISLKNNELKQVGDITNNVLKKFNGVLTLEVFNEQDLFGSLEVIEELWEK